MDLYEVLGVRTNAGEAEIRRAYQRKARQLHPALNPGDPAAAERYQAVTSAFEILSDPDRRAAYDRGEAPAKVATTTLAEVVFEGFDFSIAAGDQKSPANFRDIFEGVAPERGPRTRGEDLEQVARISFEESMKGARRRVHVVRQDRCPVCEGGGEVSVGPPQPCARCGGVGHLRARRGHLVFSRGCGDCGGRGATTERPCPRCGGEGRLIQSEWLDVEIPPGAGNGTRVRLPGLGNSGRSGGPPGDLTLVVEVEPHPFFRREGDDLHCTVPVTIVEAALGAHVSVPMPEGSVTIEIPAGTQAGQRFRLRKRGAPELGGKGRGDLFVEARIVVPTVTDERGRALLKEIATLYPDDPRKEIAHGSKS
jgi:molecular chaperone DnaJ